MARLPAAGENAAGNAVLVAGTTYYITVHTADPGTTGASEMSGVTRAAATFATWASGSTSNVAAVTVNNPGSVQALYVGVWSAITAGTYILGMPLASGVTAAAIAFAIGAIVESVS